MKVNLKIKFNYEQYVKNRNSAWLMLAANLFSDHEEDPGLRAKVSHLMAPQGIYRNKRSNCAS